MSRISTWFLIALVYGLPEAETLGQDATTLADEAEGHIRRLLETPDRAGLRPLVYGERRELRFEVAFRLLARGQRVGDSIATLLLLRREFDEQTEGVLLSLGHRRVEEAAGDLVAWTRLGNAWTWQAMKAFELFDRVPDSIVPQLRKLTRYKFPEASTFACRMLGRIHAGRGEVVPEVRMCLKSADPRVRFSAAEAILMIDPDDLDGVKVLTELIATQNEALAVDATVVLGRSGARLVHGADALRTALASDSLQCHAAHRALSETGPAAMPLLSGWLTDPHSSKQFRVRVLSVLADIDPATRETRALAVSSLNDDAIEVRTQALRTLSRIEGFDAAVVVPCLSDAAPEIRSQAVRTIAACSASTRPVAIAALADQIKHPDADFRLSVCESLTRLGPLSDAACQALISELQDEGHRCYRALEILAEGQLSDPNAVVQAVTPLLLEARPVTPDSPRFVASAAAALAAAGEPAVPVLIRALSHSSADVRGTAAGAFGALKAPNALDRLADLFQDRERRSILAMHSVSYQEVRVDALRAVGRYGSEARSLVPRLIEMLSDPAIRSEVASALGSIGPAARAAIPVMLRQPEAVSPQEKLQFARTLWLIESEGEVGLIGVRRMVRSQGGRRGFLPASREFAELMDIVVHDPPRAASLQKDLAYLVDDHQMLHPSKRVEAAYALARIDPTNDKWVDYLRRWAIRDPDGVHTGAAERLEQFKRKGP